MTTYEQTTVFEAFQLYTRLAVQGQLLKTECATYFENEQVRALTDNYARLVQCILIADADYLYLIPISVDSPFHMKNDTIKKEYLTAKSVNMDIYLMYISIIVLFGLFYDSYQTTEPADFVSMQYWLEQMNQRMETISHYEPAVLQQAEKDHSINWSSLLQKWNDMDSIKETVKKQDARTNSRLSMLNMAKDFLIRQGLLRDVGNQEFVLTEKAKLIVITYYMEDEYNHGIMDFMYHLDHKEDSNDAIH